MTKDKTVTMSRELLNDLLDSARLEVDERIRSFGEDYRPHVLASLRKMVADAEAILAAPVVERQEPVAWMFKNDNNLIERVIWWEPEPNSYPGFWPKPIPLYAAPVAMVLPTLLSTEDGPHYSDSRASELGYLAGYNACLDKVKELNQ